MATGRAEIILKPGKESSLKRFHPWVFSGAIARANGNPEDGDLVNVTDSKGNFLGVGHYQQGSITVRIISFDQVEVDEQFWESKIREALKLRQAAGLAGSAETNVFRLFNAEGDGAPGLIIDFYKGTAVLQAHSIGMYNSKQDIANALIKVLGDDLKTIFDKSSSTVHKLQVKNEYLYGQPDDQLVKENGHTFYIDWEAGQKTGFFIDQRDNRQLLSKYADGKNILNAFSYSGGFSVYALRAGATMVHSVDSSVRAIELAERNIQLNDLDESRHRGVVADVLEYLKTAGEYDLIILDPPAFAKHLSARHNAIQGYKRLNALAMKSIKKGGIIFTFSCSQAVDAPTFASTIMAAAVDAGRQIKILHRMFQPADHPVSVFHPEGEYLSGLVLWVE